MSTALVPLSQSLATLEHEIGGRGQLIQALATAPQSREVKYVLGLLADPDNQHKPLVELCRLAKIVPGTLLEMIERGTKLRARIIAGQIIAQATPDMVRDVMQKAKPYDDACPQCAGVGSTTKDPSADDKNPQPEPCSLCKGYGKLRYDADPECRKLGLEMAGLTAKGGGINIINQNANIQPGGGTSALEALQELMDKALYGRDRAIVSVDAQVLDEGSDGASSTAGG